MSQKRTIARNVFWNWLGTLCDAGVAFTVAPFLVNHLGASTYGIWILIGSMSGYFGLLDLGVRSSVGRYIAFYYGEENHESVNDIFSTAFAATCLLGLVVLAAMPLVTTIFFRAFHMSPDIMQSARIALYVIILNLALTFPLSLFDGTLWAHQRFDLLNMVDIPASLARAVLTFWLVLHGYGLVGLATMTLTIATLCGLTKAVLSFRVNRRLRLAPRHVTREAGRQLFGYSAGMFAITVSRMTRLQFTPLLIGWLLSPVAVTMYSIPKRLLDYTEKLFAAATGVLTPLSASLQAQGNDDGQQEIILRGGRVTITLAALFLAFYLAMGYPLITLWMGPAWGAAYVLLAVLALGEFVPLSQMTTWNMLLATARHKTQALFQVTDVVIAGCLAFALSGSGVSGLCIAIAASGTIFRGLAVLVHGCRVTNVPLGRYAAQAITPGLLAPALPISLLVIATAVAPPKHWPDFLVYSAVYGLLAVIATLASAGVRPAHVLPAFRSASGSRAAPATAETAMAVSQSTTSGSMQNLT